MQGINETIFLAHRESYEGNCRLNEDVCNSEQKQNHGIMNYRSSGEKGYTWNPSTCDCECDKACKIGEYLDLKIVHAENQHLWMRY